MAVFEELGNLLFPPRCLGCGQVLPLGEDCCENCQKIYCHLPPPGDWAGRPVSSAWLYWVQLVGSVEIVRGHQVVEPHQDGLGGGVDHLDDADVPRMVKNSRRTKRYTSLRAMLSEAVGS